jgi:hypothetical protein
MHLASVVGWKEDENSDRCAVIENRAACTGLEHPRSLYAFPNGDTLVIEPKELELMQSSGHKDFVVDWIESLDVRRPTREKHRITLCRIPILMAGWKLALSAQQSPVALWGGVGWRRSPPGEHRCDHELVDKDHRRWHRTNAVAGRAYRFTTGQKASRSRLEVGDPLRDGKADDNLAACWTEAES